MSLLKKILSLPIACADETVDNYEPMNRNVLIFVPEQADIKTPLGLIIPETAQEKKEQHTGVIIALAADCKDGLQIGQKVRVSQYGGHDVWFANDPHQYRLILETELKATFTIEKRTLPEGLPEHE